MTDSPQLHHLMAADAAGRLHRLAWWDWACTGPAGASAPVAVCVHGLTRQGRDFDALAQALRRSHRVVCPDMPGRGRSDWLPDPMGYGLPTYAADMVTLLAALGTAQVDWVGTSMGGLIGLVVAGLQDGRGRGLLRRLVLNDVGPTLDPAAVARIGDYVGADPRFASIAEGEAWLGARSRGFGPHTPAEWSALCARQLRPLALRGPQAPEAFGGPPQACDAAERPDADGPWTTHHDPAIAVPFREIGPTQSAAGEAWLWAVYDRLRLPVLLLRGAESDLLSAETAAAMAVRGPRARRVDLPGVGHAPTLVDPAQQALVLDFLRNPLPA